MRRSEIAQALESMRPNLERLLTEQPASTIDPQSLTLEGLKAAFDRVKAAMPIQWYYTSRAIPLGRATGVDHQGQELPGTCPAYMVVHPDDLEAWQAKWPLVRFIHLSHWAEHNPPPPPLEK